MVVVVVVAACCHRKDSLGNSFTVDAAVYVSHTNYTFKSSIKFALREFKCSASRWMRL